MVLLAAVGDRAEGVEQDMLVRSVDYSPKSMLTITRRAAAALTVAAAVVHPVAAAVVHPVEAAVVHPVE